MPKLSISLDIKTSSGALLYFGAWDISTAVLNSSFSVSAQDTSPRGLSFKPDGTKMYIAGSADDAVYEYNLSTTWDITTSTYSQSFSVAALAGIIQDITFKPDGTKMYIADSSNDSIYEYNLSTAWDISTASYLQGFSVASQTGVATDVTFKPDGTKMYVIDTSSDGIYEYDLSTAWDISTASYLQDFSVSDQETSPRGLFFRPDGTKMYICGTGSDAVAEYDLSTSWDISTASYRQNFSVDSEAGIVQGIAFKPDGTKMYVVGNGTDAVWAYDLGT